MKEDGMSETHELGVEHDHDVVDSPADLDRLGADGSPGSGGSAGQPTGELSGELTAEVSKSAAEPASDSDGEGGESSDQIAAAAAPESTDDARHDDINDDVSDDDTDDDTDDDSDADAEDEADDPDSDDDGGDDDEGDDDEGDDDEVAAPSGGRRGARVAQLEREGEVAADFLERLLDIADLDGDIDVDIDGDRAAVAIVDSDEGRVPRRLVGPDGRVLESLQELTRLAVQTATGERSRLMLDVAGYRADRRATLVKLARAAIDEVRDSGQAKALANMTAFERKVVHDEVTAAGLRSESEGVEPHRHIVISPA